MRLGRLSIFDLSGLVVCGSLLAGCGDSSITNDAELRDYSALFTTLPTASIYPDNNQYSEAKEQLGEMLFWDPILSGDQNVACASCHHPAFGWADGRDFSIGSDGLGLGPDRHGQEVTPVHSPTIMNTAFTGLLHSDFTDGFVSGGYFWDLRAETLEKQSLGPIANPVEMLGYNYSEAEIIPEIVARLSNNAEYVAMFEAAFGVRNAITSDNIANAIATFERKVISPQSRFDKFLRGETELFSEEEVIGLNTFIDGGCSRCHLGPMLSDNLVHVDDPIIEGLPAVRTPSLRNITKTAPYMHNGSQQTLRDAIAIYEDREDIDVAIGDGDFAELEAFLRTLTSETFYQSIPERVPSGLPVGGGIQ